MKIQFVSDLHLEFGGPELTIPPYGDVLVLAGDINIGTKGISWINRQAENFQHVIYIAGNHEFYQHNHTKVVASLNEAMRSGDFSENVHFLHNSIFSYNDVTFIGSTLWTDLSNPNVAWNAERGMNDYRIIDINDGSMSRRLRAFDTTLMHTKSKQFLEQVLHNIGMENEHRFMEGRAFLKPVVVTHHAPSFRSISGRYARSELNDAYASNLEYLMSAHDAPVLWIHGHMHETKDYIVENTRIVCNPRGYYGYELNEDFDPNRVVEV